ncbi:MAG: hypothetical protein FD133_158 [Erysipelotrichaceae bacterium]|nr:MAG: hypothetical protein FD179_523 [Erysipelotrichaceae bacterium]TXT19807.1 MAG: hypothetical protein FD133_158 [Erysipelotrichaceae bacterium]
MTTYNEYLFIDFENVQDVNTKYIKDSTKVKIIVGQDQKSIPFDLVAKTQHFGESVEWIKVEGKGKNALDFFIAFYLGNTCATDKDKKFIIYSKDTGYDPLIEHLKSKKIEARRIVSFKELSPNNPILKDDAKINKIIECLNKVASVSRPKKRSTLTGFIKSHLGITVDSEVIRVLEDLFINKYVFEENGSIKYNLSQPIKK